MQDTAYLFRLLNSACASMFSMFQELKLPEEILDGIINNDSKTVENAIAYLKEDQVSDTERIIKATAIRWAINTIAICGQCGMKLEKDIAQENSVVSSTNNHN
jgi:hypothetical protein